MISVPVIFVDLGPSGRISLWHRNVIFHLRNRIGTDFVIVSGQMVCLRGDLFHAEHSLLQMRGPCLGMPLKRQCSH